jgi:hypothetical protein
VMISMRTMRPSERSMLQFINSGEIQKWASCGMPRWGE